MKKNIVLKKLANLANHLDVKGLRKEAGVIDSCLKIKEAKSWFSPSKIVGDMSPEEVADIAEKIPAEKLAEIALKMDPRKRQQVIVLLSKDPVLQGIILNSLSTNSLAAIAKGMPRETQKELFLLLMQDPDMQAVAMEALGVPPGLANIAGGALGQLAEIAGGPGAAKPVESLSDEDLKNLFTDEESGGVSGGKDKPVNDGNKGGLKFV